MHRAHRPDAFSRTATACVDGKKTTYTMFGCAGIANSVDSPVSSRRRSRTGLTDCVQSACPSARARIAWKRLLTSAKRFDAAFRVT